MSNRLSHSPEFTAKVAMKVISGRNTLLEIASDGAERAHLSGDAVVERGIEEAPYRTRG